MPGMEITTNIGCGVSCAYCPQGRIIKAYSNRSGASRMSFNVFKRCLDKIPSGVIIYFSGMSEAWLNPECAKMILYAHEKGRRIGVYTTLTGMALPDVDLIEDIPFVVFCVHLPSNKNYERIRVDENYLRLLERIANSRIRPSYLACGTPHPAVKALLKNEKITGLAACSRGKNIEINNRPLPERKKGGIGCALNLSSNMLLPNGDVVLCCVDYGMKHVLGNLLDSDYKSLFSGEEFLRVKKGLKDESADILCRYCEEYAYKTGLFVKIFVPLAYRLKNLYLMKFLKRSLRGSFSDRIFNLLAKRGK